VPLSDIQIGSGVLPFSFADFPEIARELEAMGLAKTWAQVKVGSAPERSMYHQSNNPIAASVHSLSVMPTASSSASTS